MTVFKQYFRIASEFSLFLLIGTVAALVWANVDYEGYKAWMDGPLFGYEGFEGIAHGANLSFHFVINDIFMAFFFGIAMKEVSESFLPGGALSSVRKAALPAIATMGGVVGPVGLFVALTMALGQWELIGNAWAVPTATDIAYAWLFAKLVFGGGHPAVTFLLVLAVLDDLIGMLIIAVYYTAEVHVWWLGLVVLAVIICEVLRRVGVKNFWPYVLLGGPLSFAGLYLTGVHPALAFVPVVPFMPHAARDAGLFVEVENAHHNDTLNKFEHFFKPFVDVGLLFFGLANAGVVLNLTSLSGEPTWIILLSLLVGKTFGIWLFTFIGTRFGLSLPEHMNLKMMPVVGMVAGIGFTVALFVTTVAFKTPPQGIDPETLVITIDMLKLGALLSFAAGPLALIMGKMFRVEKIEAPAATDSHGHH